MQKFSRLFATLVMLLCMSSSAYAQVKVVVIPLGDNDKCDPCYSSTITVAASGADFTNPKDALVFARNNQPHASNRLLIKIAAGTYTINQTLEMINFVDIEGAGFGLGSGTILTGSPTGDGSLKESAIINGASNSELRNLSIVNTGGNCSNIGMFNEKSLPIVRNVSLEAGNGNGCYGLGNINGGIVNSGESTYAKLYDVISSGTSGGAIPSFGIYNENGALSFAEFSEFSGEGTGGAGVKLDSDAIGVFEESELSSVDLDGGIIRCFETQNSSGNDLDSDCAVLPD